MKQDYFYLCIIKMLLSQPIDHKKLIFQKLEIKDLVNLGLVCSKLWMDETRKEWIKRKLVFTCFYSNFYRPKTFHRYPFPFVCSFIEFESLYLETMTKLEFRNIQNIDEEYCRIELLGCTKIIKKKNLGLFPKNPKYDCNWDQKYKETLIQGLFTYVYDLWEHGEKNKKTIFDYTQFDYHLLYKTILNYLSTIFLEDDNQIRKIIMNGLFDLKEKTKNGMTIENPWFLLRDRTVYEPDKNQFHISIFIEDLHLGRPFPTIQKIIEIGDFLAESDELLLYYYLRETFDPFLDIENIYLDDTAFNFDLEEQYDSSKTLLQKIMSLFTLCNYNIQTEFLQAYHHRIYRYTNPDVEDQLGPEEDFDFDW